MSQALYADRVQETTSTTGTGAITLAGAVTGYRTFTSAFATGTRVAYCITNGTDWEVGVGTLATSSTLTREIVTASSNSGALLNLSGAYNVFSDLSADSIADKGFTVAAVMGMIPL